MLERISLRENWDPLKKHERKIKSRMGISTGTADNRTYENAGICRNREGKATQEKINIQIDKITQNV